MDNNFKNNLKVKTPTVNKTQSSNFDNNQILSELGLLNLPKDVQNKLINKEISMSHARVLSKLEDVNEIEKLSYEIIDNNLSVRELENKVNSSYKRNVEFKKRDSKKSGEYKYVEQALEEKLGTKVKILNNKIVINYASSNDLNRIIEILNVNIED